MRKIIFLVALFISPLVLAQDLLITNVRILDDSTDIASGNIVIASGRIVSITSAVVAPGNLPVLNAGGMTAMPGFIDGHRHIINGESEQWLQDNASDRMQEYLDAGFTTLMSGGGPVPGILQLRDMIDNRELAGPRIITSGRADPGNLASAEQARERVRYLAGTGVEIIKARLEESEQEMLRVIIDEADKQGLEVMVHAVTVPLTIDAVNAGAGKLVHTPTRSLLEDTSGAIGLVADADIPMTSTLGIWVPIYGENNEVQWRDRTPFPFEAWPRAGNGPVNGRRLFDAGMTYAFGTDTQFLPRDSLAHELIPLRMVFSPRDIITIMGPNSADFVDRSGEIGLLAPGFLADIVLIDGDPLVDIHDLLDVQVVIKGGLVVAEHR